MDDEPVEGIEVRRNPWMVGLGGALTATGPLMLLLSVITGEDAFAVPVFHLTLLGVFALFAVWRKNPWPKRTMVQVSADAGGVTILDRETRRSRRILREHIARGASGPAARGVSLRLTGRRFRRGAQLIVDDKHAAYRVLSPLGLDVHQSIATFKGMSRTYVSGWRIFGLVLAMMASTMALGALAVATQMAGLGMATPLVMLAFFVFMFAPTSIDVGADGVLYRWLGRQRYIAHDEIESVEVTVHGIGRSKRNVVVLFLRGGADPVYLPTGAPTFDGDNAELLAARIRDARDARQRGGLAPAALVRGEQSHAQWVAALRKPEAAGLRTQAPLKDDYWRVLEDVSATPLTRAAAAVALGRDLSETERARLDRAKKTVAAPKLRVVLDRTQDDDEAVAELLEALEPKKSART